MSYLDKIQLALESLKFVNPSRTDVVLVRRHIQTAVANSDEADKFTGYLLMQLGASNMHGIDNFSKLMMADDMDYVNAYLNMKGLQ